MKIVIDVKDFDDNFYSYKYETEKEDGTNDWDLFLIDKKDCKTLKEVLENIKKETMMIIRDIYSDNIIRAQEFATGIANSASSFGEDLTE